MSESEQRKDLVPSQPSAIGGDGVVPSSALEPITQVLRAQVELLSRMEQRQQDLERAVKDERRTEVNIRSAEALNESFNGMRRVQEALADRLEKSDETARRPWIMVALVVLAVSIVAAAWWLRDGVEPLKELASRKNGDDALSAALARLENRVGGVEERDRDSFRRELDELRKTVDVLRFERDGAWRERDAANASGVATTQLLEETRKALVAAETKLQTSDKEIGRLAADSAADKRLLAELAKVVDGLKSVVAKAPNPVVAVPESRPSTSDSGAAIEASPPNGAIPFAVESLQKLNDLLRRHRGSDRYVMMRAERIEGRKLRGVTLEVRGADGSVSRTIEADSLSVYLAARGDLLELEFERGGVVFRLSTAAKPVRSPFFNDRYQIVVLGIEGKAWIEAAFPFVSVR